MFDLPYLSWGLKDAFDGLKEKDRLEKKRKIIEEVVKWHRAGCRAAGNNGPTIEKKVDELRSQLQSANNDRFHEIWRREIEELKKNQAQQAALDEEQFLTSLMPQLV